MVKVPFDQALQLDPQNLKVWFNKGTVLPNSRRHQEAQAAWDRALELEKVIPQRTP
jgi:hypothetical protein